ncbi:MAG TPA: transposase [Trebonia sp.]|jgi:transposase|nr:transposase [Trebonia sp.]
MGYCGLTPSEYSSGTRTRRGGITKAGSAAVRTALVESAQAYRHRPAIGVQMRRRQEGLGPDTLARSWKAQQRLHATWKNLSARGKPHGVVAASVARELAGFTWAEMTS